MTSLHLDSNALTLATLCYMQMTSSRLRDHNWKIPAQNGPICRERSVTDAAQTGGAIV